MFKNIIFVQTFRSYKTESDFVLWRTDPLLDNDHETNNETTATAMQQPVRQWTGWKTVFSVRSAPMAAHATTDTATEEWCFLCSPCLCYKQDN
jgi:hypothetical protein